MIKNLTLALAATVVAFLLAEGATRLILPPPQTVVIENADGLKERLKRENRREATMDLAGRPDAKGSRLYVITSTGRRLRANTRAVINHHKLSGNTVEIRTNSLGYRNREIGAKKGRRILFLGDSITFGDYLPEEQTFVRRVERLARESGDDWETINAGVGAISLETEMAILKETGLNLQPDVVVVDFYLNDFLNSPYVLRPHIPNLLAYSHLLTHLYLNLFWVEERQDDAAARLVGVREEDHFDLRAMQDRLATDYPLRDGNWKTYPPAFNQMILKYHRDWGGAWSPMAWEHMAPLFKELKKWSEDNGFRLAVVAFPVRFQVEAEYDYDQPQRRLAELARELDIPLLDMLPVFRRDWKANGARIFYDHCHPDDRANLLVAEKIYSFLKGLPPAGPKG